MTWSLRQEVSSTYHSISGTDWSETFGATPTEGNDLFAIGISRPEDTSGAAPTHVLTSGGNTWTEIATAVTTNHRMSIFHRVAGASEATAVTLTPSHTDTTFHISLGLLEYSGPPLDVSSIAVLRQEANTSSSNTETATTGTLASDEPHLFISAGSIRVGGANETVDDVLSGGARGDALNDPFSGTNDLNTDRWAARGGWFEKHEPTDETVTWSTNGSAQTIGLLVGMVAQNYNEIAADDFTRSNETLSTSANWTGGWGGTPSIVSNHVEVTVNDSDQMAYWSGDTFDDDQYMEVDATLGSSFCAVNPGVRFSSSGGYVGSWDTDNGGQYVLQRVSSSGGTWTPIGTPSSKTAVGTTGTRTIRVEAVGTTITMYVDGVEELTATDSNITSGSPGVSTYRFGGSTGTLDNFSAGDWTPTPPGASIVAWYEVSDWFAFASPQTITGISWEAGDIIVVAGAVENGGATVNTPTNANLTFTQQQDVDPGSQYCAGTLFTAQAGSTQTGQTISVTRTSSVYDFGFCVWVVRGSNLVVRQSSSGYDTTSSYSLKVAENSVVCYALFDWNASNPPGKTPATGSGTATERLDDGNGTSYAQYICDWEGTSAGTYSFGPNNYTSLKATDFVIEIADYNVIATDDFNRANNASLGSDWATGDGVLTGTIASNTLTVTGDEYGHIEWVGAGSFDDDQWAELTVTLDGTNMYAGPVVRSTTGNNAYQGRWDGNAGEYQIWGYGYDLGSATAPTSGTKTLRIEAVGTRITLYADGVEVVTLTDSTHTTGVPGITANTYYTANDIVCDNFSAGDWTAAGGTDARSTTGSTTLALAASGTAVKDAATVGTSSLVLAASGTDVKAGAAAGAESLTLAAAGTAVKDAATVGTSSLVLAASGTDVKAGAAAGAESLTLAAAGDVVKSTATVPAAGTDLVASAGDTEVVLTWTAPDDGGDAITDYIVEYRVVG